MPSFPPGAELAESLGIFPSKISAHCQFKFNSPNHPPSSRHRLSPFAPAMADDLEVINRPCSANQKILLTLPRNVSDLTAALSRASSLSSPQSTTTSKTTMYIPISNSAEACLTVVCFSVGPMAKEEADQGGALSSPQGKARPGQHKVSQRHHGRTGAKEEAGAARRR